MAKESPIHRYAHEAVGAFVLFAVIVFIVALFEGGRVREWLNPGLTIRVLLPPEGLFGLADGAHVDILGTKAGDVRRIAIDPDQNMHAEVHISEAMSNFVRRDSKVTIRKTFGVAGETFLDISRGYEEPLDPAYAVLEAKVDQIPTANVTELLSGLKEKVFPVVDDAARTIDALAELAHGLRDPEGNLQPLLANMNAITGRIERGEGSFGRLLVEAYFVEELETLIGQLNRTMASIEPVLGELEATAHNIAVMTEAIGNQSKNIPAVTQRAQSVLASLDEVLQDLSRTTPELPRITKNMADTTDSLPPLLIQTQQTVAELELLLRQMRASWLLGGGGGEGTQTLPASRISPLEVTP